MPNSITTSNTLSAAESVDDMARSFQEQGFVLVRNVLSTDEVQQLRIFLKSLFDRPEDARPKGDTGQIAFDIYSRYAPLRFVLYKKKLVDVLTKILDSTPTLFRENGAQFKNYSGWHKDTTALERGGHTYHWNEDCIFLTGMYYLQDNDPETGGGLDVVPGSHNSPDRYVNAKPKPQPKPTVIDRLLGRRVEKRPDYGYDVAEYTNFYTIPSKAGDFVLFHRRIDHRATPKKSEPPIDKMAMTASFTRNDKYLEAYHNFIGHRADYYFLKDFAYPQDFIDEAAKHGILLV